MFGRKHNTEESGPLADPEDGGPLTDPDDGRAWFQLSLPSTSSKADDESPEAKSYDQQVQDRNIKRLDQEHGQRRNFFWFALTLATLCTLGSLGVIIWLTHRHTAPAAVYVAFVSGLSVEALGITGIMARHLFSRDEAKPDEGQPKPAPAE